MSTHDTIEFTDNKAAQADPEKFLAVTVDVARVLESWKASLYSFEWLDSDGNIKPFGDLDAQQADKQRVIQDQLSKGETLEKPVLGIGMLDNVEIGSGKAAFLTLAALGHQTIPVHIPKSCESDFKDFVAAV